MSIPNDVINARPAYMLMQGSEVSTDLVEFSDFNWYSYTTVLGVSEMLPMSGTLVSSCFII